MCPLRKKLHLKRPLRLVIAAILTDGIPRSPANIVKLLRPAYPGEAQINVLNIDEQAQALRAVGIVEIAREYIEEGKLIQEYCITEYGRERVKRAT